MKGEPEVKVLGWVTVVIIGYAALVAAVFRYLDWPWNILVASLALFKGTVFWAIALKIRKLGTKRLPPPVS